MDVEVSDDDDDDDASDDLCDIMLPDRSKPLSSPFNVALSPQCIQGSWLIWIIYSVDDVMELYIWENSWPQLIRLGNITLSVTRNTWMVIPLESQPGHNVFSCFFMFG